VCVETVAVEGLAAQRYLSVGRPGKRPGEGLGRGLRMCVVGGRRPNWGIISWWGGLRGGVGWMRFLGR
jgi:hypothetical protein